MRIRLLTAAPELELIQELDVALEQSDPPFPTVFIWESKTYRWHGRSFANNIIIYSAVNSSKELKHVHNSN